MPKPATHPFNYTDTSILPRGTVQQLAALVLPQLPHLTFRHHGIGLLKATLREGEPSVRLHLWHPDLIVPGIRHTGNIHSHRFDMRSTVLVGAMKHTECRLTPHAEGDYELYEAPDKDVVTDSELVRLEGRFNVRRGEYVLPAGTAYEFPCGHYHGSEVTALCVTLITRSGEIPERPRILAPYDSPPVSAYNGVGAAEVIARVIGEATEALELAVREGR